MGLLVVLAACNAPGSELVVMVVTPTPRVVVVTATDSPTHTQNPVSAGETQAAMDLAGTRSASLTVVAERATSAAMTPSPTPRLTSTPSPRLQFEATPGGGEPAGIGTEFPQPVLAIREYNLDQLVELARWGKGVIRDVTFSPNGRYLAVASLTGLYIYETGEYTEVEVLHFDAGVYAAAFSEDGNLLAVGFSNDYVQVLDVESKIILHQFDAGGVPETLRFVNEDRLLQVNTYYDVTYLWDLEVQAPLDPGEIFGDKSIAAGGRHIF